MYFDFDLYVLLDLSLVVRWGINCKLVHLKVLVRGLFRIVLISVRVVLQKCMGYLEKKYVLTFEDFGWL